MRMLHGLLKLVLAAALISAGVLLYMYPVSELYALLSEGIPDESWIRQYPVRQGVGIGVGVVAFLCFLPLFPRRRRARSISFQGTHGEVTIDLEPVEATLVRVVSKLPDVKNIAIKIERQDSPGRVKVLATAILLKDADADARMVTGRVNSFIHMHTRKILGLQEVDVELSVRRFVMNMKSVVVEPLLLEGPEAEETPEAPAPQAQAYASQPAPAPQAAPVPQPAPAPQPEAYVPPAPERAEASAGLTVPAVEEREESPIVELVMPEEEEEEEERSETKEASQG